MQKTKTVLVICRNHLNKAPRFLMEVNALWESYNILAVGISGDTHSKKYKFIPFDVIPKYLPINVSFHLKYPVLFRKFFSILIQIIYYKRLNAEKFNAKREYKLLMKHRFDVLIVHHFRDLPLAVKLAKAKNVKLIFNAHEYYPLEFDSNADWMKKTHPLYIEIGNTYLKHIDACFCVGEKIAEKYKEEFGVDCIVITNSKPYKDLNPSELRSSDKIKLVHHGAALRNRQIELMIDLMNFLDEKYTLDLVLVPGDDTYISELKFKASNNPRIQFPKSVSTEKISDFINQYDIGIYILPPLNFNDKYALPNKFFEFIQARLALAISPSPEMKFLVDKYNLGVVSDDFTTQSLAAKISNLSFEQIMFYKNRVNHFCHELSAENNEKMIKNTVDTLTKFN
jgi:hypothetical protein